MPHRLVPALVLSFVLCSCAEPDVAAERQAIVGGVPESAYPAVGALVLDEPGTFASFCTATLIHPRWVVTAGHCWSISGYAPSRVSFFVGADARTRTGGTTHRVAARFYAPGYDALDNDVALVMLEAPVSGVTPMPHSTRALSTSTDYDRALTWVGFGDDDGVAHTGGGTKRRITGTMGLVFDTTYLHTPGTCQGDSGGPAFADFGAGEVLVGVVNGETGDCTATSIDTRIDIFASWIASTIAENTPCDFTGGECGADACWPLTTGETRCFPSNGLGALEACDPTADPLECADGYACGALTSSTEGACLRTCFVAEGCADGSECRAVFDGRADIGLCVPDFCSVVPGDACAAGESCEPLPSRSDIGICRSCVDADADGFCADEDCDDSAPSTHPGATELCANAVDDDCDGRADAMDDACSSPSDGDAGVSTGEDAGPSTGGRGRGGCAISPSPPESPPAMLAVLALALALRRRSLRTRGSFVSPERRLASAPQHR